MATKKKVDTGPSKEALRRKIRYEQIPLNQLEPWEGNVRKVVKQEEIDELAASIKAIGLIQNLVVLKQKSKWGVAAGQLRLLALRKLAKNGDLSKDTPIPCEIIEDSAYGSEVSLAENVQRFQMDPVDEALAFKAEADERHRTIAEIAARFGRDERFVKMRIKLGSVEPKLINLYRGGKLKLDALAAFTLVEDHGRQWEVWKNLPDYYKNNGGDSAARIIRQALSENTVASHDRRVRFVGLDAYKKAGGRIQEDLFSREIDGAVQILDEALLDSLVMKKLEREANKLKPEGWANIVIVPSIRDHEAVKEMRQANADEVLSPELEAKRAALEKEFEEIEANPEQAVDEEGEEYEYSEQQQERMDAIERELAKIASQATLRFPEEITKIGTAFVSIGYGGELKIERGWIPKGSKVAAAVSPAGVTVAGNGAGKERRYQPYSRPLIESLTRHKTAAIAAELAQNPEVALAGVLHALITGDNPEEFWNHPSSIQIGSKPADYREIQNDGRAALQAALEPWQQKFQTIAVQISLWDWCVSLSHEEKLSLLAVLVARSFNAVQQGGYEDRRVNHAEAVARTLEANPAKWFRPTVENFFGRISKHTIALALREMDANMPVDECLKMKKPELAELGEKMASHCDWIPDIVRVQAPTPEPTLMGDDEMDYDEEPLRLAETAESHEEQLVEQTE